MERWQSKGKVGPYRGVLVPYHNEKGKRQGLQGALEHVRESEALREPHGGGVRRGARGRAGRAVSTRRARKQ